MLGNDRVSWKVWIVASGNIVTVFCLFVAMNLRLISFGCSLILYSPVYLDRYLFMCHDMLFRAFWTFLDYKFHASQPYDVVDTISGRKSSLASYSGFRSMFILRFTGIIASCVAVTMCSSYRNDDLFSTSSSLRWILGSFFVKSFCVICYFCC